MFTFPLTIKNPIFFIQNRFSSLSSSSSKTVSVSTSSLASSKSKSKSSSFTVDFLVNSCGLTLQSAITTSQSQKLRLNENNIQRCDSVLHLLKSHGFSDAHIAKIIQKFPLVLTNFEADEVLKPKLDYLVENGFAGPLLHDLIVSNPCILRYSLSDRIKPSVEFLKSFLGTEERLRLAVKRYPRLLNYDLEGILQPNINLFVEEGVPVDAIAQWCISDPSKMVVSPERMLIGLKIFKDEFGNSVASPTIFLKAVSTLASMDVNKKVKLFKSLLGCSQEKVLSMFRRYPTCFSLSEETLRDKLDFYFNTVQFKPEVIINNPTLLGYSIGTRASPRYNLFKLLLSKELVREDISLAELFGMGEQKFLDKYVTPHLQQVPSLLEIYTNDKMKKQD